MEEKKILWEKELNISDETKIIVGVYRYKEGEPKLGLTRKKMIDEGMRFAKLGWMTKKEVKQIMEILPEALKELEEYSVPTKQWKLENANKNEVIL